MGGLVCDERCEMERVYHLHSTSLAGYQLNKTAVMPSLYVYSQRDVMVLIFTLEMT
jgi:hypothetical protein